jgi:peptidoglycan/LPS O-acetylase OafA/YrhL
VQTVFVKHLLAVVAALFLVLPAVFGDRAGGWPRRVMAWGLLAWMGLISYGIYLWHDGVVAVLEKHGIERSFTVLGVATIVTTAAVAAASYYLVERPILRFKVRRPRPQAAPRRDAMPV